ncbi:uncharacterized protein F5891DRAFT_1131068 [Suillus fuscotomentosus]|uniref:Uncharacterized protein n=1 Tax=Suillus fuscotomentosus TaxID=1912939 RepID=A0AAD4DU51_9AGAM|nr:uncharacterized protein F5891DRAFT_1131068 [Suillus fuscotomentosus]KAG1893993.1 hypothetical protein F5891DRAFT_1131068 [Suillus fuscotomentosus]
MVSHSFVATNSCRWVQAQPPRHPKVTLSKEARAAITAQRRNKSHQFRVALHNAWDELDETMKTIVSSHHKSFRRVQNDLCMGRGMLCYQHSKLSAWNTFCWKKHHEDKGNGTAGKAVLQDLVGDENHAEYRNLTDDEKAQLLQEYCEHKETKTTGIRISTKSKVNDVTQTLKAVENELKNLWTRTGAESILYTTHGSTDLPLRGIAFATEGVNEFMGSVMNIDNQDLVSKMEGFAVQGMKGAVRNHQKCTSDIRSAIHQEINKTLCWPENVPFVNLSTVSSALPDLEMLLDKWETGEIHWKHLDEDEYEKLRQERCEKVSSGEVIKKRCQTCSDKEKKREQPSDHSSHRRKTYKSAQTVISDDESDIPNNTASHEHTPAGSISTMPEPTPPAVPSLVIPKLASSTPPTVPSLVIPELASSTPPAVPIWSSPNSRHPLLPLSQIWSSPSSHHPLLPLSQVWSSPSSHHPLLPLSQVWSSPSSRQQPVLDHSSMVICLAWTSCLQVAALVHLLT